MRGTWRQAPLLGTLEVKEGSGDRRLHRGPTGEPGRGLIYRGH